MRKSKPDILMILAILIGIGVVTTEVVQAVTSEPEPVVTAANR